MSTTTQYNPNDELNARLDGVGASKTVYALTTPQTRAAKRAILGYDSDEAQQAYFDQFEEAWTKKQDSSHVEFFDKWHEWSKPVIDLDRKAFPFFYPTAGASQAIQHLIYSLAAGNSPTPRIHVFEGEYEGYKAIAESAYIGVVEHKRKDWNGVADLGARMSKKWRPGDAFFISQPSAIDGNVWGDFNDFVANMPEDSVVVDATYVGAVPEKAINLRFNFNAESISNIVFSLSKPFGVYYDRVGGVWCRGEDAGLFGYKWFKNLTSLALGTELMKRNSVFEIPEFYAADQNLMCWRLQKELGIKFTPSDVYILATAAPDAITPENRELVDYLTRAGKVRICLSNGMDQQIKAYRGK